MHMRIVTTTYLFIIPGALVHLWDTNQASQITMTSIKHRKRYN